tara:strand:- start:43 stop:552 length:510 start_codon:yes stop_codon:yes gene_type:complete
MKKLHALRAHIIAAVPQLRRDPDRLLTFVDDGRIEFNRGPALTHEYHATVRLVLTDYVGEPDAVILPVLQWLNRFEPDLDPNDGLRFEILVIDHETVDLELDIQITERVIAKTDCATGRIEATHLMHDYGDADACGPQNWQLYVWNHVDDDQYRLVAEWPAQSEPTTAR